jgi:hypothetical protein
MSELAGIPVTQTEAKKMTNSFYMWCEKRAEEDQENFDVESFSEEQNAKILAATSVDEVWAATDPDENGTESSKEIPDVEMEVHGFTVRKGQAAKSQGNFKYFFVVRAARLDTGEQMIWTTGVEKICITLKWFEDHEELPLQCVIRAYETSTGNERLLLRPIAKRAVKGTTVK